MAWTYAATPGTTSAAELRDAVRLALGDTDTNEQQLTDAEVSYVLAAATSGTAASILTAAIAGCRILIARFARQVSYSRDGLSVSASDRAQHYRDLLADLVALEEAALTADDALVVWAGGQSIVEKYAVGADSDQVQPIFQVGMDDNPNAGSSSSGSTFGNQ